MNEIILSKVTLFKNSNNIIRPPIYYRLDGVIKKKLKKLRGQVESLGAFG